MPINFIIGVSDYKISSCDYIIAGTNYIITTTDYRINRHFDVFYAYVDKFSSNICRLTEFVYLCKRNAAVV